MREFPFERRTETCAPGTWQFLGIRPNNYQCLAQTAISASELASIEATVLESLENSKPGAICTLYGAKFAFSILVDCAVLSPSSS